LASLARPLNRGGRMMERWIDHCYVNCQYAEKEGICYEAYDGEVTEISEDFVCDKWKKKKQY
jgi:hypothetical protein